MDPGFILLFRLLYLRCTYIRICICIAVMWVFTVIGYNNTRREGHGGKYNNAHYGSLIIVAYIHTVYTALSNPRWRQDRYIGARVGTYLRGKSVYAHHHHHHHHHSFAPYNSDFSVETDVVPVSREADSS